MKFIIINEIPEILAFNENLRVNFNEFAAAVGFESHFNQSKVKGEYLVSTLTSFHYLVFRVYFIEK